MLLKFLIMYSVVLFCPLWRNLPVVIIDLTGNWLPVSEVLVASHLYYKLSLSAPFKYSNVNPVLEVLVALITSWLFQIPQTTEPRLKILFGWPGCRNGTLFGCWWPTVCVWEVKNDNYLKEWSLFPVTGAILKSEVNDAARFLMVYDGLIIAQAWQAIALNTTADHNS